MSDNQTVLYVYCEGKLAGRFIYHSLTNAFAFEYEQEWRNDLRRYPISPNLPYERLSSETESDTEARRSATARRFFENLLPEGRALDDAARAYKVDKNNLTGLIIALGQETAGALSIRAEPGSELAGAVARAVAPSGSMEGSDLRLLTHAELSQRINERPGMPFTVWDNKVRLSIAGYQDKIAVFKNETGWHLVDKPELASTVILKPEPIQSKLAGMTSNEFFCMRLARHAGLPAAEVRLVHVPEPVLEITRFDREVRGETVFRRHIIDGCQALDLAVTEKYEHQLGYGTTEPSLRLGASFPRLFAFTAKTTRPGAQRLQLLRWAMIQVLIGNTDAHGKNISYYVDQSGIRMAPAYDIVCALAYNGISDSYAMSIGDAFMAPELSAFEWAHFAASCGVPPKVVAKEMKTQIAWFRKFAPVVANAVVREGARQDMVDRILNIIYHLCDQHERISPMIANVDPAEFKL